MNSKEELEIKGSFTKMPNYIIKDNRLSIGAKGIYMVMVNLIMIPDFVVYKSMVMRQFSNGASSFDRAWNELKAFGYLTCTKHHVNGRFAYKYEVFEYPFNINPYEQNDSDDPAVKSEAVTAYAQPKKKKSKQSGSRRQPQAAVPASKTGRSDCVQNRKNTKARECSSPLPVHADPSFESVDSCPNMTASPKGLTGKIRNAVQSAQSVQSIQSVRCSGDQKTDDQLTAEMVREQIEFDVLAAREGEDFAKEIVYLMEDVYNAPDEKRYRINGFFMRAAVVKERFRELDYDMVQVLLSQFRQKALPVSNIHAYMLTALYNQPAVHHLYIQNEWKTLEMDLAADFRAQDDAAERARSDPKLKDVDPVFYDPLMEQANLDFDEDEMSCNAIDLYQQNSA